MRLKVHIPDDSDLGSDFVSDVTVKSFRDIVAIGHTVARQVRDWLRQVPMTPHVKQKSFYVSAEWVEAPEAPANPGPDAEEQRPKRKRKSKR